MISKKDKNQDRVIRHARVRKKVSGTEQRPRLSVYRSTNHIYAQLIDDVKGNTLCAASTLEKDIAAKVANLSKSDAAKEVGKAVAAKALKLGYKEVVFDRGGYLYTGRVQALAEGAREAGLEF
ncbi:MAG: 50S ribosomal protein L18 [Clostridia bacterium]|nr:50S ribosomal protein L18 [Clostridia bacterium]